jgi:hypothetical protein
MFKFFKDAAEAVRKGNEYRREKYGDPETLVESFQRAQAYREWYNENLRPNTRSFFLSNQDLWDIESLKLQCQYWDCWTGGRFAREENPYINKEYFVNNHRKHPNLTNTVYADFIRHVKMGCVLRSDPVTGYWQPLEKHPNE